MRIFHSRLKLMTLKGAWALAEVTAAIKRSQMINFFMRANLKYDRSCKIEQELYCLLFLLFIHYYL